MEFKDPIYAIIKVQDYCIKAKRRTPKVEYYISVCDMAEDVEYVPTDYDIFTLEDSIRKERNPELKEALQEICDYLCSW